eukprot:TRINITY_DN3303_c0_g1_i1.p1 TRINITY_DN3303_c0_g1~~TRINITY_DN3303_c0_g1_i1.p1  ORF type:complete len:286 (-),score=79.76 TRINITY_DN3303_c0_g1_i1:602-1459(-)
MEGPLSDALEYIKQAVQLDEMGKYAEAIHAYTIGVDLCKKAQTIETSPEILVALPDKIAEYNKRIKILQFALINEVKTPAGVPKSKSNVFSELEHKQRSSSSSVSSASSPKTPHFNTSSSSASSYKASGFNNQSHEVSRTFKSNHETSGRVFKPEHDHSTEPLLGKETQKIGIPRMDDKESANFHQEEEDFLETSRASEIEVDEPKNLTNSIFLRTKRGETSLEKALNLCKKAKEKDRQEDYVEAFKLYIVALEYFQDAAKKFTNWNITTAQQNNEDLYESCRKD